jgi:protein SCO1/2
VGSLEADRYGATVTLTDGNTSIAHEAGWCPSVTRSRAIIGLALSLLLAIAACGGGEHDFAGYRVEPVPELSDVTLPDLTAGGTEFAMTADPGKLLVVYFGYTNCPDFCPTTMSDLKFARQRLDEPDDVQVAMVTIDPERDLGVLADYVTSFAPDGHALGTDDFDALDRAAAAFGVSYQVGPAPDGSIEVSHTTSLYAVDGDGRLVMTWPFGVEVDALSADLGELLRDS